MQEKIYKIDKGLNFGKWNDSVSNLIYYDCMEYFLKNIDTSGIVADYGGANGILKKFIPNSISIDIDKSKKPDVVDNILTHVGKYNLIIMRYVLHYLTDIEVKKLFKHIKSFHLGKILVIQFTNENNDLVIKKNNSINENKYFRSYSDLVSLLVDFKIIKEKKIQYNIGKEFYINRLNNYKAKNHKEECYAFLLS